ncbi:MAG: thiamine diphosphokinase [Clostridia bacterium]|nr:thiamine diphosphokinase [Clostridia bacterium]
MMTETPVETAVILAGEAPQGLAQAVLLRLAAECPRPFFLAADGGALHLAKLGLAPDLIIGDNDSAPPQLLPQVPRQVYPRAKDFSDGEAAYDFALCRGQGRIAVFAALGGRMDHCLANLFLPLRRPEQAERFVLYGADCRAIYSQGRACIEGQPGDRISVLPLTPQLRGLTLDGLVYPLSEFDLIAGSSLAICNEMAASRCEIRHCEGLAIIFHYPLGGILNKP